MSWSVMNESIHGNADFITAVYDNAWWVLLLIIALLAWALRSIVLPIKALSLNVVSAAYGSTVVIWRRGLGTTVLFGQTASGAITVWLPIAVFAFLFGLSMDDEVFLLTRIGEEYDRDTTPTTPPATAWPALAGQATADAPQLCP